MSANETPRGMFEVIREKTGINPLLLIAGVIGALTVVFMGQSERYVTALTGILFPAYMSLKAIDSEDKEDDKQWCTYWVVFFLFEIAELYFGYILHFLPLYFLIKLVFLVWLFFPTTNGACFLYSTFLCHFYSKYESKIDQAIDDVKSRVSKATNQK